MALDLQGDLSFTVEGPGGSTSGTVVGDGTVLRVRAEDPVAAWDGIFGSVSTGPAALRKVADGLADEGLSVEVTGPHGLLALVGADADSGVGRLLTGSRRVRLGSPGALRPLVVAQVRRSLTRARVLTVVAGVVVTVVLRRRTRR